MVDTRSTRELPPGLDAWPPTADDLPYDDGEPLESNLHAINIRLLVSTLEPYLAERRHAFIGDNMFVYFSPDQVTTHDFRGPDVFVVLDVPPAPRKSWVVWQEDGRVPNMVIELMSDSTASIDRTEKQQVYQDRLRVPEMFLFHPWTAEFLGYRLVNWQYQPVPREPDGSMISEQLGLKLVVWGGVVEGITSRWLRWATPDGVLLPRGIEAAQAADARANVADARAEAAVARAEAEAIRAETEAARADAEAARAEAEAEQRRALEAELARYRARFGDIPAES